MTYVMGNVDRGNLFIVKTFRKRDDEWSASGGATNYSFRIRRGVLVDFKDRLFGGHIIVRKLTEHDADALFALNAQIEKLREERRALVLAAAKRGTKVKVPDNEEAS